MKKFAILLVLLCGCAELCIPTKTEQVSKDTSVDTLFTDKDGYTVKRFRDSGHYRYYVTPGPARVVGEIQSGKVTVPDVIETK